MADDHRDEGGAGEVPAGKGKEKRHTKSHLYAIAILCIVLIVIAAALVTLTVQADLPPEPGTTYPYTTTYAVLIPEGKPVSIAGMEIIVLASGDEMLMRIGDRTEKFVVGETKTISERHAVFRTLGIGILGDLLLDLRDDLRRHRIPRPRLHPRHVRREPLHLLQVRDGLVRRERTQLDPVQIAQQPTVDRPRTRHAQPHRVVDHDLIRGGTLIGATREFRIRLEHTYILA